VQGREDSIIRLFPSVHENGAPRESHFTDELNYSASDGRGDRDNAALVIQLLLHLADFLSYR
jgi:hypothetical protein